MRRTDLLENIAIVIIWSGVTITFGAGAGLIVFGLLFLAQVQIRGWFEGSTTTAVPGDTE